MALLQEITVPLLAVNDTSLTVIEITCADGQQVKKGDHLMVFETSKTTFEVIAETAGFVQYFCENGRDYEVNAVVAKIFSEASEIIKTEELKPSGAKENTAIKTIADPMQTSWEGETLFSEEALLLLESSGLNRADFKGKDFAGKREVEEKLGIKAPAPVKNVRPSPVSAATGRTVLQVDHTKVIVEKLSSNKKREIEYLSEVQSTGLTSTVNIVVETEGIFTHINKSLKYLKNSLLPVIMYESARLLQKYPQLNAYFTGEAIALYNQVHIGFAIDLDKGLKVLKVANTAEKGIGEIESEIMTLSDKYLDDGLVVEDLVDITFTITDLSAEGISFFRPLINMMNSAILGVSSIDEKLQRCTLSITFDHRVTEGKRASKFLHELKERLESYQSTHHANLLQGITCSKCFKTLGEDLADTGFVKCITPAGKEGYLCQSCLKGF